MGNGENIIRNGFERKVYSILKSNTDLQKWLTDNRQYNEFSEIWLDNKRTNDIVSDEIGMEILNNQLLSSLSRALVEEKMEEFDKEKFCIRSEDRIHIELIEPDYERDFYFDEYYKPSIFIEREYTYIERIQKKKKVEIYPNEIKERNYCADIIISKDTDDKIDWTKVKKVETFSATSIDLVRMLQIILGVLALEQNEYLTLGVIAIDIVISIYNAAIKNKKAILTEKQGKYLRIYLENTDFGKNKSGIIFEDYYETAKAHFLCINQTDCIQDLTELVERGVLKEGICNTLFLCDSITIQKGKRHIR